MCVALLTTAHPDYALIVIDNRDEFILRPTSRPHWWTPPSAGADTPLPPQQVLSARDLQRSEHGTWLGVTRAGHFAVLTNFRENSSHDRSHPVHGQRSRGAMVTAWLTADPAETTEQFVTRLLAGPGVRGVGGFSLICGKLRRRTPAASTAETKAKGAQVTKSPSSISPLAIISNRTDHLAQIPWIADGRGQVYGLSNTSFDDPQVWPKVGEGKKELLRVAVEGEPDPEKLRESLFAILDRDTLPSRDGLSFDETIPLLKNSIFIPAIGDDEHKRAMAIATAGGRRESLASAAEIEQADRELLAAETPDQQETGFMTGLYGTQRQTVMLVDWDGNVSFTERALFDANGNPIPRGQGDVHYRFRIDGWDDGDNE